MMPTIQYADVEGAVDLVLGAEAGINKTFRGTIVTSEGERRAYIKWLPDDRQLVNEVLAWALAAALGLSVSKAYLARVHSGLFSNQSRPEGIEAGFSYLAFASCDLTFPSVKFRVQSEGVPGRLLLSVLKGTDWMDIVIFDTWVANVDRHIGNVLIGDDMRLWLIDHGHCFTGPEWTASDLVPGRDYLNRLWRRLEPFANDSAKPLLVQKGRSFTGFTAGVPIGGLFSLAVSEDLLNGEDALALNSFLSDRASRLAHLVSNLVGTPMFDFI